MNHIRLIEQLRTVPPNAPAEEVAHFLDQAVQALEADYETIERLSKTVSLVDQEWANSPAEMYKAHLDLIEEGIEERLKLCRVRAFEDAADIAASAITKRGAMRALIRHAHKIMKETK